MNEPENKAVCPADKLDRQMDKYISVCECWWCCHPPKECVDGELLPHTHTHSTLSQEKWRRGHVAAVCLIACTSLSHHSQRIPHVQPIGLSRPTLKHTVKHDVAQRAVIL